MRSGPCASRAQRTEASEPYSRTRSRTSGAWASGSMDSGRQSQKRGCKVAGSFTALDYSMLSVTVKVWNDPGEVHLRPKITAAVRPVSTLMVGA